MPILTINIIIMQRGWRQGDGGRGGGYRRILTTTLIAGHGTRGQPQGATGTSWDEAGRTLPLPADATNHRNANPDPDPNGYNKTPIRVGVYLRVMWASGQARWKATNRVRAIVILGQPH